MSLGALGNVIARARDAGCTVLEEGDVLRVTVGDGVSVMVARDGDERVARTLADQLRGHGVLL